MVALARKAPRVSVSNAAATDLAADLLAGLQATPKWVAAKHFYDAAGSALFERITELPEYYPTRCELGILHDNAVAIAELIRKDSALVEFGSGSSKKDRKSTRLNSSHIQKSRMPSSA